jgi:hypothetical protein
MNEKESSCEISIRKTLAYRAVFRYPMSFYQLGTFLICDKHQSFKIFKTSLEELRNLGAVRSKKGRYSLKNAGTLNWGMRERESKKILKQHQETFRLLGKIPWVKLLAVTGATAAFNFKKGDDLDVFTVTQKNRLWITRLFVVLLLKSLGRYRTDEDPNGKICPNLFVSEDNLSWNSSERDVFVAHEIVMMHPFINRDDMYFRFMKANDWVLTYFGNINFTFPARFKVSRVRKSRVLDAAEVLLMRLQVFYMRKKKTLEVTSRTIIHFNRDDSREKTLSRYQRLYNKAIRSS